MFRPTTEPSDENRYYLSLKVNGVELESQWNLSEAKARALKEKLKKALPDASVNYHYMEERER
jgi:hypothetical protein